MNILKDEYPSYGDLSGFVIEEINGYPGSIKRIMIETTQSIDEEAIKHYEKSKGFIRWVDKEPRKIYTEEQECGG